MLTPIYHAITIKIRMKSAYFIGDTSGGEHRASAQLVRHESGYLLYLLIWHLDKKLLVKMPRQNVR